MLELIILVFLIFVNGLFRHGRDRAGVGPEEPSGNAGE